MTLDQQLLQRWAFKLVEAVEQEEQEQEQEDKEEERTKKKE